MPEVLEATPSVEIKRLRHRGHIVGGREVAPALCEWVMRRCGTESKFDNANAIGLVRDGRLVVAVVYNNFHWPDICMHVAAEPGALWAWPFFVRHAFAYPFLQLNCRRVTGLVARKNTDSQRLCQRMGFELEGVMKEALPHDDLLIYGLLRSKCRYIAQEERKAA